MSDSTTAYALRGVPEKVWREAKARAALEGKTIREVIIDFLRQYGAKGRPTND